MTEPAGPIDEGADENSSADPETHADGTTLREEVERKYDFDNFGPADMAKMTVEEWEAAFDPETWITGSELLDRVEAELKNRIASRDVFATFERDVADGSERLVVYSDEGYAVVSESGDVRGRGTVLRDLEPIVALCSMDDYDVPEPPANWALPDPEDVSEGSNELGNLMMQVVAGVQLVAGFALFGAWIFAGVETLVAPALGVLFLLGSLFFFSTVANARLSDRFRSAEYRDRLRALQAARTRPDVPPDADEVAAGDPGTDEAVVDDASAGDASAGDSMTTSGTAADTNGSDAADPGENAR
ncbi:hypothetical protein SAMN05192561_101574 [Halopenitus malekzadehii]|uniref:DUF7319 domain-containing protein n=1 Tax=Halopenitus malekzadehii TaxID=1267564 RepID=A0A1H6I0G2_9EURY|nr:hypothetical protein [Halopenitus malekzadehii]SEH39970.1 hypothetical protein SAMN05192561_101574 [Halopenitus malekzadehii]